MTSGSGGAPKGVLHAQRAAWARRMMWEGWYGLGPDDRMLHAGAFNWTYTLGAGLIDPLAAGATALIYTGPADRHVWPALAAAHGATIFAAAPGVYRQMHDAPGLGDRLRQRAPRPQRRRGAARGGAGGVERGHRPGDPRGARHVRDLDLRLGLAVAAGAAGHRGLSAAGAAGGDPARGGGASRSRAASDGLLAVSRRDPGPDARLLAAAGGDRGRLPRGVVRHRRPGADGRGRRRSPISAAPTT